MQLFVIRHGQTEWNKVGRKQGHGDSPLTELGELQAHKIGVALKSKIDLSKNIEIFASPLGRAKHTAHIIIDALGLSRQSITFEPLLKEASFGLWEGYSELEIQHKHPDQWQQREADKWDYRIPEGESHEDLASRAKIFFASLSGISTKLVITHQMMSRCLQHVYLGLKPNVSLNIFHPQDIFYEYQSLKIKPHKVI